MAIDSENQYLCLERISGFVTVAIGVPQLQGIENTRGWAADPLASQSTHLVRLKSLKGLVGERGFEPPTPWSRNWGRRADFVVIQSFEWASTVSVLLKHASLDVM